MNSAVTNMTLGLNENRDLYVDATGNLVVLTGLDALTQSCEARIEAQLHEMLYAYNQGMPTLDTVFRQQRLAQFVAAGRARLLTVPGVLQIKSFVVSVSNSKLAYTADILTIYSATVTTVSNQGV